MDGISFPGPRRSLDSSKALLFRTTKKESSTKLLAPEGRRLQKKCLTRRHQLSTALITNTKGTYATDDQLSEERNVVERFFHRIKKYCQVANGYAKLDRHDIGFVLPVSIMV